MSELKPCPFCGMGLTLDIDEEGGVAILHSLKGEKNCWFPSIVEIETPVETTLEEMAEILNRRPIQESFEHALVGALTKNIIAKEIIQRFIDDPYGCRFCDFGVLRKPGIPEKDHDEDCLYLAARAYLDNDTSVVVKRDLSDAEIEELGAREAESRGDK